METRGCIATELLPSLLCFPTFAVLLSLHKVDVYISSVSCFFLTAGVCMIWPSITCRVTEVCPHMQQAFLIDISLGLGEWKIESGITLTTLAEES